MLSVRVDHNLLEKLRAGGKGWQPKVHALLRKAVERGPLLPYRAVRPSAGKWTGKYSRICQS